MCTFTRVPTAREPSLYVALCETGGVHGKTMSTDAEVAFQVVRSLSDAPIVACDAALPESEAIARTNRVGIAPLADPQRETRALLALLPGVLEAFTPDAIRGADLMRYLEACADFAVFEPWKHPLSRRLFEVSATGRGAATRHALVVQQENEADGPGFGLLEPDVSFETADGGVVQVTGTGVLQVQMMEGPAFAAEALAEAFGITQFPLAATLRKSPEHAPLLLSEVRLLTGVFECVCDLVLGVDPVAEVDGRRITMKRHRDDVLLAVPGGHA